MSSLAQIYVNYKLLKLLALPFSSWDAFKLGIIDDKGNELKKASSVEERRNYGLFEKIIRRIKFVMNKFIGQSRLAAVISTLYLMRDHVELSQLIPMLCELDDFKEIGFPEYIASYRRTIKDKFNRILVEEKISNTLERGKYSCIDDDPDELYFAGDVIEIKENMKPIFHVAGVPLYEVEIFGKKIVLGKDLLKKEK